MKYHIKVSGCDDKTEIIIDLTDDQAAFVKHLSKCITETSTYGCMPRMYVQPLEEYEKESCDSDEEWTERLAAEEPPFL